MIFSYFQHFLGNNHVVKGMIVVKEGRLTVHFPKILLCQVFKNYWNYICGSSQNIKNVFCQEKVLKISAESVKYIGGGDYFLLNLTALMHATLYTKRVVFCKTPLFV